jgi:dihydroorotate dehydrogenase
VLASGILGVTASSWMRVRVTEGGAGAATTKSIWMREHKGHPNPTIIATEHWTLNAVGVPDAGPEKAREEISAYMRDKPAPLIVNIIADTVDNYGKTAEALLGSQARLLRGEHQLPQCGG